MSFKKIATLGVITTTILSSLGVTLAVKADELTDTAYRVIRGDFGNGETRKSQLAQDYPRIQEKVNELLSQNSPSSQAEKITVSQSLQAKDSAELTVQNVKKFSTANVSARTQYSHTENGHVEGGYYNIFSSIPNVVETQTGKTLTGTVTRSGIGLEKGSINLAYVLNFDENDTYISGNVTSSGYVNADISLVSGQNYSGQTINFLQTTGGYAGSGSYIYPINASLLLE